jgi:hypothetical protein
MAEIEYSLQIINYLSFAPSGATANFTNVTVIGLNAGSGTFTTVEATNYDDLVEIPGSPSRTADSPLYKIP